MGLPNPPKLSQSAYWVLRLPYIYQGDDGPILPPTEVTSMTASMFGCLLAGMYGVSETETESQFFNYIWIAIGSASQLGE